jgi:hypothetical protein
MATFAVFVALGGGAYAAVNLPRNSVGNRQIRRGAVSNSKLAARAVTASKVARHTLTGTQIDAAKLGTVPSATKALRANKADSATHAASADSSTTASQAADAGHLGGLGPDGFVQGGGSSYAARVTLALGGGGFQHILTIPGYGEVVGGCGSGGGVAGFVNHSGHDLHVNPFAGGDLPPVTITDGGSSGVFPSGVGSAGYTFMQIGSADFSDQKLLQVTVTRDAQVSNHCNAQAWAVTH